MRVVKQVEYAGLSFYPKSGLVKRCEYADLSFLPELRLVMRCDFAGVSTETATEAQANMQFLLQSALFYAFKIKHARFRRCAQIKKTVNSTCLTTTPRNQRDKTAKSLILTTRVLHTEECAEGRACKGTASAYSLRAWFSQNAFREYARVRDTCRHSKAV